MTEPNEELRRVRDTLIEELRKSETLTVASRALYARYSAMCEGPAPAAAPEPEPEAPAAPARQYRAPVEEDEEFGGSFMVRSSTQPNIPGYRDTPTDVPRSLRDRRR
jgi:hypothetical protein